MEDQNQVLSPELLAICEKLSHEDSSSGIKVLTITITCCGTQKVKRDLLRKAGCEEAEEDDSHKKSLFFRHDPSKVLMIWIG